MIKQEKDKKEKNLNIPSSEQVESAEKLNDKRKNDQVVEYGSATELTKGKGGRRSEQGYSMP